ncbi:AMP-binding protein [Streptomyces pratensis]|uniref:AMP-binding protein n=1 Tax=Streptomyces pratensis TaxID=1169025 RepID=UPI0019334851|nr:AMP-binding protein [Streptomyces pratensis]
MIGTLMHSSLLRRGDATAVVGADGTEMDATSLHEAAVRLASALRAEGAGPGEAVAIALPQSVEQAVALVAVAYTGADFVLVDLDAPPARSARFLDLVRPRCVVVDPGLPGPGGEHLAPGSAVVVPVRPEGHTGGPRVEPSFTPSGYYIQTSGTTGEPKVLRIDGTALENRLRWGQSVYPLALDDVVLSTSRPSFDFYVWELAAALCFGARLVLTSAFEAAGADALFARCKDEGVTTVHFFPRMLDEFSDLAAQSSGCPTLRRVFSGGAPLPGTTLAKARAALPGTVLFNQYGPAECCIDVSWLECEAGHERHTTVPVGRPVDDTTLTVVDGALRPVPSGTVGEILVGGIAARTTRVISGGTADAFVTLDGAGDSAGSPGARRHMAYRTGDFGYQDADGLLHYVGRTDSQFKIHAARVDLTEVTAVVRGIDGVTDCHVYPTEGRGGEVALGAVIESATLTRSACRSRLATVLPLHMVPTAVDVVESLPRTSKLEVDVARLTDMCGLRVLRRDIGAAPASTPGPVVRAAGAWARIRPASLPEQRLIGIRRTPGRPSHLTVANHLVIQGSLDVGRLTEALRRLVARHAMLRTTYAELDGRVAAVVHEQPAPDVVEIRDLADAVDDATASIHLQDALAREADLFSAPDRQSMMRAVLHRRADDLFSLLLVFDHIAIDERSKAMLQEELTVLYRGDGEKLDPATPYDPARVRSDFSPAREIPALVAALDPLPPRVLPSPDPVAEPDAFRAGSHEFTLLAGRGPELDGLVRRLRCTRFEFLLATFFRAMKTYTGQHDILVVVPADTRNTVEDFETVGFFQNLIPVRSRTAATASPRTLVDDCKRAVRAALAHRDYPVARLAEEFRDPSVTVPRRNPIWQIAFVHTADAVDANWTLDGLTVTDAPLELREVGLELNVEISDTPAGLAAAFRYAAGALSPSDATRLAGLWDEALTWVLEGARAVEVTTA